MAGKFRKSNRNDDLTRAYQAGAFDNVDDDVDDSAVERFGERSKDYQKNKTLRTQQMRQDHAEIDALPLGEVIQIFSLYSEVLHEGTTYLCTQRKTLAKISDTQLVVGDRVRFAPAPKRNESGLPEGVIERIEPRDTVLTRAESFKQLDQHPIVANAQQMLIVAALHLPEVKWGLIDRMVIAARAGKLEPIVCLNKIDTAADEADLQAARDVLAHYESLGIRTLQTCAIRMLGIDEARAILKDKTTVLAGHSGVGKSSLVRAIEPSLDLRVGEISSIHNKGKHTTTSARRYPLSDGGYVIDTPGVKLFGLWNVTAESLIEHFPDVENDTAPAWRRESYERILQSLRG